MRVSRKNYYAQKKKKKKWGLIIGREEEPEVKSKRPPAVYSNVLFKERSLEEYLTSRK